MPTSGTSRWLRPGPPTASRASRVSEPQRVPGWKSTSEADHDQVLIDFPELVVVGLGSNLDDPAQQIVGAVRYLDAVADVDAFEAVFAPDLGPSDGVSRFTPPLTWVAIEDLVRGARGPAAPPGTPSSTSQATRRGWAGSYRSRSNAPALSTWMAGCTCRASDIGGARP